MSGLDHLWAGWRSEYITSASADAGATTPSSPPEPLPAAVLMEQMADCVFCSILDSGLDDDETHVVWRDPSGLVVALLNAYPYASGHLMVMPVRHTGDLGRAGGAGVPGHLHLHVLPRWMGDTNFMTSVADTRVLPEALSATADKLRTAWTR
jgi:ATP adenylyltransferase